LIGAILVCSVIPNKEPYAIEIFLGSSQFQVLFSNQQNECLYDPITEVIKKVSCHSNLQRTKRYSEKKLIKTVSCHGNQATKHLCNIM
jgi:hypothetical protein